MSEDFSPRSNGTDEAFAKEIAAVIRENPQHPEYYIEKVLTKYRTVIEAGAVFAASPIMDSLRDQATAVHEATGKQMTGECSAMVRVYSGGLMSVEFGASTGCILGKGPLAHRSERGASPATAAGKLIEDLQRGRVAQAIRVQFLRQTAEELGFEIVEKKTRRTRE